VPACVPEHANLPTTVSPSATSSTIRIRTSVNEARNGSTHRRAAGASRGEYRSSRTLRLPWFITSSMSRRTTFFGSRSDTAPPIDDQLERGEYMITANPTRRIRAPAMSYPSGRNPSSAIPPHQRPGDEHSTVGGEDPTEVGVGRERGDEPIEAPAITPAPAHNHLRFSRAPATPSTHLRSQSARPRRTRAHIPSDRHGDSLPGSLCGIGSSTA
jgi:hypothetical protein